ncbi:g-protein coupled receptor moody [Caerostris extrusa]|uniref:G-protein coupled receptor moody n=1 Tax=Caerostris extrusa TaxID=172846 RepID=A0AAV4P9C6_CAEEX|nr:g-protein coupled receptor moody [Caerostris extrusa]
MIDVKNMSALVTDSWMFTNGGNNTTSEDKEHLRALGTHGNETVFFYYPAALMDFAAACFIIFTIVGVFGNFVSILALSKSKTPQCHHSFHCEPLRLLTCCSVDFQCHCQLSPSWKETGTMATSYASCFLWSDIPMVQCLCSVL